jgi:glycosyltransferase involved in cell wall biosynthesis
VGDAAFAVSPDDARQMAGAIISILVDEPLAEELKQKGLQRAARFSWEETATQTLLVYDRLLGDRPASEGG